MLPSTACTKPKANLIAKRPGAIRRVVLTVIYHISHRCQAPLRSNRRAGQSQPAMATNYTPSRSNSLVSTGISTWPRKPRNPTTFKTPWESIAATCLGAFTPRKTAGPRRRDTSWTSSRSSSLGRAKRGACCGLFLLHRRGGQKAIGLRHLLAAGQRSIRSAGLIPDGYLGVG
jgi:hypothetical protein